MGHLCLGSRLVSGPADELCNPSYFAVQAKRNPLAGQAPLRGPGLRGCKLSLRLTNGLVKRILAPSGELRYRGGVSGNSQADLGHYYAMSLLDFDCSEM
jgi:hypothetical protein